MSIFRGKRFVAVVLSNNEINPFVMATHDFLQVCRLRDEDSRVASVHPLRARPVHRLPSQNDVLPVPLAGTAIEKAQNSKFEGYPDLSVFPTHEQARRHLGVKPDFVVAFRVVSMYH